ncbi:MAG TPA: hypothetical protein VEB20_16080, partial [Azospirillaceae bacterium]|nr:hypothetical protein [Azospirillaceae bacterium]
PNVYTPLADALAEGPKSVRELQGILGNATNLAGVVQALSLLTHVGSVAPLRPPADPATARRLNRVLCARARASDTFQALAAPATGSFVVANLVERLALNGLDEGVAADAAALARHAWGALAARGQRLIRDGKPIDSAEENTAELQTQIGRFLNDKLPLWRTMGVV